MGGKRRLATVSLALLFGGLMPGGAFAGTIGFDGTTGGSALGIRNTSTSALITNVTLTIGDTAFSYDSINIADGGSNGVTLISPDRVAGSSTTKQVEIAFSSF